MGQRHVLSFCSLQINLWGTTKNKRRQSCKCTDSRRLMYCAHLLRDKSLVHSGKIDQAGHPLDRGTDRQRKPTEALMLAAAAAAAPDACRHLHPRRQASRPLPSPTPCCNLAPASLPLEEGGPLEQLLDHSPGDLTYTSE